MPGCRGRNSRTRLEEDTSRGVEGLSEHEPDELHEGLVHPGVELHHYSRDGHGGEELEQHRPDAGDGAVIEDMGPMRADAVGGVRGGRVDIVSEAVGGRGMHSTCSPCVHGCMVCEWFVPCDEPHSESFQFFLTLEHLSLERLPDDCRGAA